jgi:hypothetical protein
MVFQPAELSPDIVDFALQILQLVGVDLPIQVGISGKALQLVGMVQSLLGIGLNVLEDRVGFALKVPGVGRGSRLSRCALTHRSGGGRDRRYSNRGGDATTPEQRSESHFQLFFLLLCL